MKKSCLLVAGGTGGHINAARAIGEFAAKEGYQVRYATGQRPLDYKLFQGVEVIHFPGQGLRGKDFLSQLKSLYLNFKTFFGSMKTLITQRPNFVLGCGGYICGPVLVSAFILRVPIYLLEQNSIAGMTNKLLAPLAQKIFLNFSNTKGFVLDQKRIIQSGNPVRQEIRELGGKREAKDHRKILVFGGSLGASEINTLINKLLDGDILSDFKVLHQVGLGGLTGRNQDSGYQQTEFIDDMAREYLEADIIISRAGASTLSELRYVEKPCILIPFPYAVDNHQKYNAEAFKKEVSFPVLVGNLKDFEQNEFAEIREFLNQTKAYKKETIKNALDDPREIIFKEIQSSV